MNITAMNSALTLTRRFFIHISIIQESSHLPIHLEIERKGESKRLGVGSGNDD